MSTRLILKIKINIKKQNLVYLFTSFPYVLYLYCLLLLSIIATETAFTISVSKGFTNNTYVLKFIIVAHSKSIG